MDQEWIQPIRAFLEQEDKASLRGQSATVEEIEEAQFVLNVVFHDDYVAFIQAFGGAYAGVAVHAFSNGSSLGSETVTELTLSFRDEFTGSLHEEILRTGYVIAMDGSGNPIVVTPDGQVVLLDHDNGEIVELASSFSALIKENFFAW